MASSLVLPRQQDGALLHDHFENSTTLGDDDYYYLPEPARQYLKLIGRRSLHAFQHEAIRQTMAGCDTMIVVATGGGKSLCYQLAPLLLSGAVLVVSPLIALVHDQVRGLLGKNASDCSSSSSEGPGGAAVVLGSSRPGVSGHGSSGGAGVLSGPAAGTSAAAGWSRGGAAASSAGPPGDRGPPPEQLLRPIAVGGGSSVSREELAGANLIFASML